MLRLHELDVDSRILVPARSARIDQQLNVDAFLVHVVYASLHVPVVAFRARKFASHESAGDAGLRGSRLRLAQHARHVRSPASDGTAAKAESAANPRVGLSARRDPVEGYLAAFQIRRQLADAGGEVLF